jgi:hypothetical protein
MCQQACAGILACDMERITGSETLSPGEVRVEKRDTGYGVVAKTRSGLVWFFFSELSFSKRSIETVLEIELNGKGFMPSFVQRIDLRSSSAIRSLVTDLNNAYGSKKDEGGYNWSLILNSVVAELSNKIRKEQQPISVEHLSYEELPFLAHPFLQTGVTNLLFAQSEAGKTWFALRLAFSLVTGAPFLDYQIEGGKRILFIDYEDNIRTFTNRLYNLSAGMGVKFKDVAPHINYYKPTGSFRDNTEQIKRMIAEHNYNLIIIDAGGDAAGGSPSDEEKVLDLFNAMEEVNCTKLVLHHEPKYVVNEAAAFYGSMYWKARSRVAWRLEVESEDGGEKIIKASIQKRSNLGYMEPFYYKLVFDSLTIFEEHEQPITLAVRMDKADINPNSGNVDAMTVLALNQYGDMSVQNLKDLIDWSRPQVFKALVELEKGGVVERSKTGRSDVWSLTKKGHQRADELLKAKH